MANNNIPVERQVQNHTRINNTVVARLEKKALLWLAARMPGWVVPDTLTAIGLFASVLIFFSYALTYYHKGFLWLASFGFILQWFGDSLDGTLARYRKIERPRYGFFIDHILDTISEVLIFVGLGLSPYLRFDLSLIALICYLMASIYVYLTTYVTGVFRISYSGLGPTEIRMIAILTNTVVFFTGNPAFQLPVLSWLPLPMTITLFDAVAIGIILLIVYLFLASTFTTAQSLSRADREAHRAKKAQDRAKRTAQRQAMREQRVLRKAGSRTSRSGARAEV